MAPSGRIQVHLSSTELQGAKQVALEVIGTGETASTEISGETRPGAGWNERVAVPAARDAKTLRVTVAGPDGVLGAAEHPLHKVLAADHEEASLALKGEDGSVVGSVDAVLRFFHGRSQRAQTEDEWSSLHRQVSRQASLRAQLVR
jgi:hypothetical protein